MSLDAGGEVGVVVEVVRPDSRSLGPGSDGHARSLRPRLPDVPAQRAAVQVGEVLDVVEEQPVPAHEGVDRGAREVAEVLVVDRVELAVVDQVADVRVLDRHHPVVGEQRARCPPTKSLRSGTCAITLLAMITSAGPCSVADPRGQLGAEELLQRRDAGLAGGRAPGRAPGRRRAREPARRRSSAAGSRRCWRARPRGCLARGPGSTRPSACSLRVPRRSSENDEK